MKARRDVQQGGQVADGMRRQQPDRLALLFLDRRA